MHCFSLMMLLTSVSIGQMQVVADFLKTVSQLPDDPQRIYLRIVECYRKAKDISNISLPRLKENYHQNYKLVGPFVELPWTYGKGYRTLDPKFKWNVELIPVKSKICFIFCWQVSLYISLGLLFIVHFISFVLKQSK